MIKAFTNYILQFIGKAQVEESARVRLTLCHDGVSLVICDVPRRDDSDVKLSLALACRDTTFFIML